VALQKALDLLCDPRFCVHNAVSDRMAANGEFKVYGRALNITNREERQKYLKALFQKIGDPPVEHDFHCFAIDIESTAANTLVDRKF